MVVRREHTPVAATPVLQGEGEREGTRAGSRLSVRDQTVAPTESGTTTTAHALLCPADLVMRWRGLRRADYTHAAGGTHNTTHKHARENAKRMNVGISDYGYRSVPGQAPARMTRMNIFVA